VCLKKSDITIPEGEEESSSDEDDEDDSDEDDSDSEDSDGGDNGVDDRIADEISVVGGIEAEATKTESRKKGVATEELASVREPEPECLDVCLVISSCPNLIEVFRTTSVAKLHCSWVSRKI